MSTYYSTPITREADQKKETQKIITELIKLSSVPVEFSAFKTVVNMKTDIAIEDFLYNYRCAYNVTTSPNTGSYVYRDYNEKEVYENQYTMILNLIYNNGILNVPLSQLAKKYQKLYHEYELYRSLKMPMSEFRNGTTDYFTKMRICARRCGLVFKTYSNVLAFANRYAAERAAYGFSNELVYLDVETSCGNDYLRQFNSSIEAALRFRSFEQFDTADDSKSGLIFEKTSALPCLYLYLTLMVGMYREIFKFHRKSYEQEYNIETDDNCKASSELDVNDVNGFDQVSYRKKYGPVDDTWIVTCCLFVGCIIMCIIMYINDSISTVSGSFFCLVAMIAVGIGSFKFGLYLVDRRNNKK